MQRLILGDSEISVLDAFKLKVIFLFFVMILMHGNGVTCVMTCMNVTFLGEGESKPSETSVVPLIWLQHLREGICEKKT